ncbi:regulator of cell cycle RGCC-like isoform X1 [Oncorhynchus nerka]|uniref:regulator of cell cycle RGCC-like isoform X1 n=1 Tax=Oncorhynchus nerka TaxID=8023 RepID=UPI0011325DA3|nr:regulator of cell cycle RGCC-like isoform X1 [Oncorhynchus nerka]
MSTENFRMPTDNFSDLELELTDLLQEFADVVEELREPSQSVPYAYERLLSEAKRRTGLRDDGSVVSDSGVEDNSDCSSEVSLGNSWNTSEEELHTAGITVTPKARMGDTGDLQRFIDSLDRELAGEHEGVSLQQENMNVSLFNRRT